MNRITSRPAFALSLLAACGALGGQAHAGMMLTPAFFKGSDTIAAGALQTTSRPSGDQVANLSYDFSQGGLEAAANLVFGQNYAGTHVRIRLRAPATARLALKVQTATSPVQVLTFQIDRTNTKVDASGWETQTVQVSSGAALNINAAAVVVNAPATTAPASDKAGTVSFRGVEVWPSAPPASGEPILNKIVTVTGASAATTVSPISSLTADANYTGDNFQRVSYDFSNGGFYAGAQFTPPTSVLASFARFRVWAAPGTRIMLRVNRVGSSDPWFYLPNSRASVDDGTGWVSYLVPISSALENIQSVAVITQQPFAPQSGNFYVKDVELLDHAPSAHEPLAPLNASVFSSVVSVTNPANNSVVSSVSSATTSQGLEVTMPYNFAAASQYASASAAFTLQTAVRANRLRFLAKVPLGTPLSLSYTDDQNNVTTTKLFKPLAVANDSGWVPYVIKLEPMAGPIKKVTISVDRSANNSNITTASLLDNNTLPTGTAYFKQILLRNEPDQLDLTPTASGLPGMTERGALPWSIMGVVSHDPLADLPYVQELGLPRMRYGYSWQTAEPVGQALNVTPLINMTNQILAAGIKPMVLLAYNTKKYSIEQNANDHAKIGLSGNLDDINRAAFVNYAQAATAPFASNPNVSFEVWNEPNHPGFWAPAPTPAETIAGKPAQEYSALLAATAAGVGTGLPVISGGLATINFPYLHALSKTPAFTQVSRLGLHPYSDAMPEFAGEGGAAALAMIQKNAADLSMTLATPPKVWVTEVGHSSNKLGAPFLSDVRDSNGILIEQHSRDAANLKRQAILVARQMLTSAASGAQTHIVYRIRDRYSCVSYDSNESNYGLYAVNYPAATCPMSNPVDRLGTWSDKPASRAVKTLRKAMDGRSYQGMITASPSNVQAMKLEAVGKETVYVVWASVKGSQANVTLVPNCDTSKELDGAAGASNPSCVRDLENNPLTCSAGANGRQVCPVSDDAGPIFVRTKRAD